MAEVRATIRRCSECAAPPDMSSERTVRWVLTPPVEAGGMPVATPHRLGCPALPDPAVLGMQQTVASRWMERWDG